MKYINCVQIGVFTIQYTKKAQVAQLVERNFEAV